MSDDETGIDELLKKIGKNPGDYEAAIDDFQILKTIVETTKSNPKNIGMAILRAYQLGKGELYKDVK